MPQKFLIRTIKQRVHTVRIKSCQTILSKMIGGRRAKSPIIGSRKIFLRSTTKMPTMESIQCLCVIHTSRRHTSFVLIRVKWICLFCNEDFFCLERNERWFLKIGRNFGTTGCIKNRNLGNFFMFFRSEIFFKNDPIKGINYSPSRNLKTLP